jgi:hypothetical protein
MEHTAQMGIFAEGEAKCPGYEVDLSFYSRILLYLVFVNGFIEIGF